LGEGRTVLYVSLPPQTVTCMPDSGDIRDTGRLQNYIGLCFHLTDVFKFL